MDKLIKMIAQNILDNWGLTDYVSGTVLGVNPIKVKLNEKIILEPINLILTEELPLLRVGDKLVMLSVCRKQKYIILGKVVGLSGR